jgi:hypothetical protein
MCCAIDACSALSRSVIAVARIKANDYRVLKFLHIISLPIEIHIISLHTAVIYKSVIGIAVVQAQLE